jgi:hypothetical protein
MNKFLNLFFIFLTFKCLLIEMGFRYYRFERGDKFRDCTTTNDLNTDDKIDSISTSMCPSSTTISFNCTNIVSTVIMTVTVTESSVESSTSDMTESCTTTNTDSAPQSLTSELTATESFSFFFLKE